MKVAPRAGAWIETSAPNHRETIAESPLAQGRGLKLVPVPPAASPHGRPSRRGVD